MEKSNRYITNCGSVIKLSAKTLSHIEAHCKIIDCLPEAISQISFTSKQDDRIRMEIDLVNMVGKSSLLNTEQIDIYTDAYFCMRKGREGASRVVLNEKPQVTSIISIYSLNIEAINDVMDFSEIEECTEDNQSAPQVLSFTFVEEKR